MLRKSGSGPRLLGHDVHDRARQHKRATVCSVESRFLITAYLTTWISEYLYTCLYNLPQWRARITALNFKCGLVPRPSTEKMEIPTPTTRSRLRTNKTGMEEIIGFLLTEKPLQSYRRILSFCSKFWTLIAYDWLSNHYYTSSTCVHVHFRTYAGSFSYIYT